MNGVDGFSFLNQRSQAGVAVVEAHINVEVVCVGTDIDRKSKDIWSYVVPEWGEDRVRKGPVSNDHDRGIAASVVRRK